jgi:hypothetical protein
VNKWVCMSELSMSDGAALGGNRSISVYVQLVLVCTDSVRVL